MSNNQTFLALAPPPPGVIPNFINPTNQNCVMRVGGAILLVLTFTFLFLRLGTRAFIVKSLGWDDLTNYGLGMHYYEILVANFDLKAWLNWNVVSYLTYMGAMGTVKVSILLLYLRVFSVGKPLRYTIYATLFVVVSALLGGELSLLFGCKPLSLRFTASTELTCIDLHKHVDAISILNIITDLFIGLLPIPILIKLKLRLKEKILIICIFMTGLFVCGTGIARLVSIFRARANTKDPTYDGFPGSFWRQVVLHDLLHYYKLTKANSFIECNVAVICACAPTLRPLRNLFPKEFSSKGFSSPSEQRWHFRRYASASKTSKGTNDSEGRDGLSVVEKNLNLGESGQTRTFVEARRSNHAGALENDYGADHFFVEYDVEAGVNKSIQVSVKSEEETPGSVWR
ncbi:MAG: hypothetical protein M1829_000447 [Trizodia sp. TS-e1964]|nr:MAG: hypothetical protein M1829_000447 [Trizodia sp. TS-e1964]